MMQSTTEGCLNIAELANQLTREKIFISSERQLLQNLNEEVEKSALELLQAAWICSQQRQNLTDLINSRCEADSVAACQRASSLEGTTFIDVYKVLKYKEGLALGELLGWLRDCPHLVALCLLLGEEYMSPTLPCALVAGLYGSCRLPADRTRLLAVLRSLVKHQLATSSDPRKLFRSGKCALATLYGVFRDGHAPARQFLAAALNAPVMAALHEDEFFLDIHPDRAMERFSPQDRLKKFGQSNSAEYNAKVARYRKWIVQRLYQLTSKFIASLREHWANFPASIAWLIQQSVHLIKQHSRTSESELHGLCTDLVLNHFICPAILNPEAHGVVDAPVSYIARTNLMQIAQILQVLCLAKHQEVEPKLVDLYCKFERSCVYSLVDEVCGDALAPRAPAPPADSAAPRTDAPSPPSAALFSQSDLHSLITFLRRISSKLNNNTPSVTSEEMSSGSGPVAEAGAYSSESGSDTSTSDACASSLAALLQTMEPNYRSRLHDLLRKMPDLSKPRQSPPQPVDAADTQKKSILAKVPKPRLPRSGSSSASLAEATEELEVYVIQMARQDESDYVGLVPESKVLEWYCGGSEGDAEDAGSALVAAPGAPVQKRTRFSVSHDEVSLGNTSDNLEAVSEAASNHSVTSSLELETEDQNDNLSDMVSANVSGRGSPNISGRETPSSQVTDGDAANDAHRRLPQNAPVSQANSAQAKLLKQTRNDIEDKFCKFEIKKLLEGDECVSIMSDTWSTDVLASDSETVGDSCDQTLVAASQNVVANTNAPDVSETASESAWSMDVLASDSDRNTEVDTDDCVSVAARSDTSWPRRLSQQEEPVPIKHNQQNGAYKKPEVSNSPKHAPRPYLPNRSGGGYLSATAQLTRGAEVDLGAAHVYPENRKSILVNGYPVMTCYATSAPESPGGAPAPPNVFDYGPQNGETSQSSSTLEPANSQSDATSQWVDDSFPPPHRSPAGKYDMPGPSHTYDEPDVMDRSLNSSESSFNALSVSQYDRRFDSGIDTERNEDRSVTDLMTRMSSATVSTSIASNVSRIKAEIRTSIVSISSSRSLNSSESSFNALSVSQYDRRFDSGIDTERNEDRSVTDLMTRMSSATVSTSIASNVSRIKAEIRTSIVSISSSRIEKKRETSNISLSTLSVNSETSVSDRSSSQDVNSENVTERRVSPPPVKTASTGAIPKSISFDATAEKSQRRRITEDSLVSNLDELKNNMKRSGGNLLHKFKMFSRPKGRSHQHPNDIKLAEEEALRDATPRNEPATTESSDDILAKYRRKSSGDTRRRSQRRVSDVPDTDADRCEGTLDLNDPEVFNSMKKKLRLVLSNPELLCTEYVPNRCTSTSLVEWMRAASTATESGAASAQAFELARALSASGGCERLAEALRADLDARRPYAKYLASCRSALTHTLHALRRQINQVRTECASCARAAAAARALQQLERGNSLRRLARHHSAHNNHAPVNGGELMDEKAKRLMANIKTLIAEVKADPSWEGAPASLIEVLELTVERAAFGRLYLNVLFPIGDGDYGRDQVLSEHIRRLSGTSAARAGVSARHLWAAPYTRAQLLLTHLSVYRTPRDKLQCVMRCVTCVMAVLGLTEGSAPSADDLTPVLVFIILKVNPPSLLSTIDFVNALGGAALQGPALYWWTQFCAAVAYIKTMDYSES